jgi:DNA-binding transcriptional LysR family regulator
LDSLSSLTTFVHAAETRSFTQAGRMLGLSSSAVGKTIARLELHLGVRLFHRSTRSIALTSEGEVFLETCRRVLQEIGTVERELAGNRITPKGRLRISLPILGGMFGPVLTGFMAMYPEIELDVDFSDRLVDIVNDGFDVAIRSGEGVDSRLMSRRLGVYRLALVASPAYLRQAGVPQEPADLLGHKCIHHRYPETGKLERWPLRQTDRGPDLALPVAAALSTLEPMVRMAELNAGIVCVPDFTVARQVSDGSLVRVLQDHIEHQNIFRAVWPSSRLIAPRLRVFLDYLTGHVFVEHAPAGKVNPASDIAS